MKIRKTVIIVTIIMLLFSLNLTAQEEAKKLEMAKKKLSLQDKGEALVRTLWKNMKQSNITKINKNISSSFQSLHRDGVRDRQEEIQLISKLDLGEYKLSNFTVTHTENLIIVSYDVRVTETIEKKRLEEQTTPRTSIFEKIDGKWLWVYHVNPVKL